MHVCVDVCVDETGACVCVWMRLELVCVCVCGWMDEIGACVYRICKHKCV